MAKYIPMGYIGDVKDIAHAMLYLACDEARLHHRARPSWWTAARRLPESPVFLQELEGIKTLAGSG